MTEINFSRLNPYEMYDLDAERRYLCCALLYPSHLDDSDLEPSEFHDHRHSAMFAAIREMRQAGQPVDTITLGDRLQRTSLQDVFWPAYVTDIAHSDGESLLEPQYRYIIHDMAARRRLIMEATEQANRAMDITIPAYADGTIAKTRFRVRTAADALQPQPPLEWVVEPIISRGSVSIFYGEPGSKKTYSMLSLAVCAAMGRKWLNFNTNSCRTLIIDEESGEKRLGLRLGQTLRGTLASEGTPLSYVSLAGLRLNDPTDAAAITTLILEQQAGLAVIDSLAAITTGDENSKEDVQPLMSALRGIAETTGAAVVVIHHSGKSGVYRGSSTIKAACDLMVLVRSEDGSDRVDFRTEKNRDGEATSWSARAVWVGGEADQFSMEAASGPVEAPKAPTSDDFVLGFLAEHGPCSLAQIMASAEECSPGTARLAVYKLAHAGRICRVAPPSGGKSKMAWYDVLEPVQE